MATVTGHSPTISPFTYFLIFGALLALTLLTVLAAEAELGHFHTLVALAIAVVKATLVVLFFMHLLHSSRLTWLVVAASLFFLGILMFYVFEDYHSRTWLTTASIWLR